MCGLPEVRELQVVAAPGVLVVEGGDLALVLLSTEQQIHQLLRNGRGVAFVVGWSDDEHVACHDVLEPPDAIREPEQHRCSLVHLEADDLPLLVHEHRCLLSFEFEYLEVSINDALHSPDVALFKFHRLYEYIEVCRNDEALD